MTTKSLGVFEIAIGILSIEFSYYSFYRFMNLGNYLVAFLSVLLFLGYGLLALKNGVDNLK